MENVLACFRKTCIEIIQYYAILTLLQNNDATPMGVSQPHSGIFVWAVGQRMTRRSLLPNSIY